MDKAKKRSLVMNYQAIILGACCLIMTGCKKQASEQQSIQCIAAKVSIGDRQIDSVIQWNVVTGETRLLNAASFSDKSTGKKGSLIGWVPVVDLQQALRDMPVGPNQTPEQKGPEQDSKASLPSDQPSVPAKPKNKAPNH